MPQRGSLLRYRGVLSFLSKAREASGSEAARRRRLGYAQGRNLDIDYRYGPVEKLEPLARELIALKPDILVASAPSAAIAFKGVAPTLPIVCLGLTDAGIPHLFASYARPGGNVTGMAQSVEGVTGKLVDVARTMSSAIADTRRNWLRWCQTSYWPAARCLLSEVKRT
jgi:hypothetical protein